MLVFIWLMRSRTASAWSWVAQNTSVFSLLVDLLHEQLHAVRLALLDLDDLVEVGFRVALAGLDLALDQLVVGRVDVLVERRGNLLHLEGVRKPSLMPSLSE